MKTKAIENHLVTHEARWFAIYTKFKREKVVAKFLQAKGIETYLPTNKVKRVFTRRVKNVELPLIYCYVFVKIKKSQYIKVLETENVIKFVKFSENLISIPEEEIKLLKRVTGEFSNIETEFSQLCEGDLVEIIGGTMTGVKGFLVKKNRKSKFGLQIKSLGYSLLMDVDKRCLRRIPKLITTF